jgi:hypothetical protein
VSESTSLVDVLRMLAAGRAAGRLVEWGRAGGEDGANAVRGLLTAGRDARERADRLERELAACRAALGEATAATVAAQASIRSLSGPDARAVYDRLDVPASGEGWTAAVVGRGASTGTVLEFRGIPDGHVHVVRDAPWGPGETVRTVECVTCTAAGVGNGMPVSGVACRRQEHVRPPCRGPIDCGCPVPCWRTS